MGKISYSRVKRVECEIAGNTYYFKSEAEFNYACYLQSLVELGTIKAWKYEMKRFHFATSASAIVKNYLPDFYISYHNGGGVWVEIKGRNDPRSRQRHKLFAEQYPTQILKILLTKSPEFRERAAKGIEWGRIKGVQFSLS
jgi:hypothetical protein